MERERTPPKVTILPIPDDTLPQPTTILSSREVSFSRSSPDSSYHSPSSSRKKDKRGSTLASSPLLPSTPSTPAASRPHKKRLASRLSAPLDSPAFLAIRKTLNTDSSPSSPHTPHTPHSSSSDSPTTSGGPSTTTTTGGGFPSFPPVSIPSTPPSPSTPPLSLSLSSSSSSTPRSPSTPRSVIRPSLPSCSSTPAAGISRVSDSCLSPRQKVEKSLKLSKIARRKSKSGRKSFLQTGESDQILPLGDQILSLGSIAGGEAQPVKEVEEDEGTPKTKSRKRASSVKSRRPSSMLKPKIKKGDIASPPANVLSPTLLGLKSPFQRWKDDRDSLDSDSPLPIPTLPPYLLFSKQDWDVSHVLQENGHFLSLILLQEMLSSSVLSTPRDGIVSFDWLMNIIIFMNHQHAALFLASFSVELHKETNTATVMRERSVSVRVLQYIWEQLDIRHIVDPLRKGGADLTKDIPLLTKGKEEGEDEKETKKKSKLLKKIQDMIYNLLNEESLPPMVPYLCWECRKTFLKVRAEQGEEEMTGKQLDRWIVGALFLLRFLIPKITNKNKGDVGGTGGGGEGEAGRLLVGKLLMKLCSQSLFPSPSCVLSEFLLSAHPLFDNFCERVMEKGKLMSVTKAKNLPSCKSERGRRERSQSEKEGMSKEISKGVDTTQVARTERMHSEKGVVWGGEEVVVAKEVREEEEEEGDLFVDRREITGEKEKEALAKFVEEHRESLVGSGDNFLKKRGIAEKKAKKEENSTEENFKEVTDESLVKLMSVLGKEIEEGEEEEEEVERVKSDEKVKRAKKGTIDGLKSEEQGRKRRGTIDFVEEKASDESVGTPKGSNSSDGVKRKKEKSEKRKKRVKSELGSGIEKKKEEGEKEEEEEEGEKKKKRDKEKRRGVKSELGSGIEKKKGGEREKMGKRKRRDERVRDGWGGGLENEEKE